MKREPHVDTSESNSWKPKTEVSLESVYHIHHNDTINGWLLICYNGGKRTLTYSKSEEENLPIKNLIYSEIIFYKWMSNKGISN